MRRFIEALKVVNDALRGERGAPEGNNRNPTGANQWSNRDLIPVRATSPEAVPDHPATIPLPPSRPKRDYSREPQTGTSTGYALRRLDRQRPDLLERVKVGETVPFRHFEEFVSTPPLAGLGVSVAMLQRLCKDDKEALDAIDRVTQKPDGRAGKPETEIITDNIRNDSEPTIIPMPPPVSPPRRDRSNDLPGGTSRIAHIRRLTKETEKGTLDPVVLDRVRAGELTPHGAMVEAGLRLRSITVDDDPQRAARRLLKHFQGERLEALMQALAELAAGGPDAID